jgi:competence transcription factor ComK
MANFISVTSAASGKDIYINVDHIVYIAKEDENNSSIEFTNNEHVSVNKSIDEVLEQIDRSQE